MKMDKNILVPNWNQFENSKHRPTLPYVFTEHGVLMTANIKNNDKRVNEIIVALNNLIQQPPKPKTIGFRAGE